MIESDDLVSDTEARNELSDNQSISISLKGHYYVNELKNEFSYIEMILQDTPIFDSDFFTSIKEVFPLSDEYGKRPLNLRVEVVLRFMKYLTQEEKKESVESERIAKGIVDEIFDCNLRQDIRRIRSKIPTA